MPGSKRVISQKHIEKEIYKTFELFKNKRTIEVALYLKSFDASIFEQKKYRKIKYDYTSMIKLVLYQKLKGMKFQTRLVRYLKRHPGDKYRLGFSVTPDQTTISYFINRVLDEETKRLLDSAADKIIEVSEKFGILFDVKTLEPEKPKKNTKERNQRLQKNVKTNDVCKLFKKRLFPFVNLHQHHNVKYSKNVLFDLLIHLGLSQDFAENGSKTFRKHSNQCPDADTLLYHLKKYGNNRELHDMFLRLFEVVWQMAKQANLFDVRKRVDVAVDYTEWLYYGKDGFMVTSKKPERGTHKCYKFATINIVEAGERFTLLAIPVTVLDSREKILTTLLRYAQQRVKIRYVYADRGFFDSVSIRTICGLHLKYLMPAIKSYTVKRILDVSPVPAIIKDFTLRSVPLNLAIVEDIDKITNKKVKRVFATNIEFDENDAKLADRLKDLYSKRWGIETSYRVKHGFRGKTTSKNYMIRQFYFMFSVLLYNLWILADVLIWLHLFGKVGEKHLIASKDFGTDLMTIDPGG